MHGYRDGRPELYDKVRAMIPFVEGEPCVCVERYLEAPVFHCRRVSGLHIDEYMSVNGRCDWIEPSEARPDELPDQISIGYDCLEVGPGWWYDNYFHRWFVFDPDLVQRSLRGDHSWVEEFKATAGPPEA